MLNDAVYDSAMDFEKALNRQVDEFAEEASLLCRRAGLGLWANLIEDTPRETSRARTGWIFTADTPSEFISEEGLGVYTPPDIKDPGPAETSSWWLVNNVEYIEALENGHSQQAPEGMVALGMQYFTDFFNELKSDAETIE